MEKAKRHFDEKRRQEAAIRERFGEGTPPVFARGGESLWMIVGNEIYFKKDAADYGFMTAIHDYALHFFGLQFLEAEEAKPLSQRHPAMQWLQMSVDEDKRFAAGERDRQPIGAMAAWYRLAYDLYTIKHNGALQMRFKSRLLDPIAFQGARHELKIAAMCIGAGYTLTFEDELDNRSTHFEFVAANTAGLKIAVEAKSRHRRNVLGFSSGKHVQPGETVGVRSLITDSFRKKADLPFFVFIDVNLPPAESQEQHHGWLLELDETMMDLAQEGYANPCPANIVFFMNDPSHYMGAGAIGREADQLWIKPYEADQPRIPHPNSEMRERFIRALWLRAAPPTDLLDPLLQSPAA